MCLGVWIIQKYIVKLNKGVVKYMIITSKISSITPGNNSLFLILQNKYIQKLNSQNTNKNLMSEYKKVTSSTPNKLKNEEVCT